MRACPGQARRAARLLPLVLSISFILRLAIASFTITRETQVDLHRPEFDLRLTIQFYDNVRQVPWFVTDSSGETCLSIHGRSCIQETTTVDRFVGAFAIVHFQVTSKAREQAVLKLRERVRVLDQDVRLPDTGTFEATTACEGRHCSDIQLFGSTEERFLQRKPPLSTASDALWRLERQELFYGDEPKPFAILHWRHTLYKIILIDMIPVGTTEIR